MSNGNQPTPPASGGGSNAAATCTTNCPPKLIEVHWAPREAMCGDPVRLIATAENMQPNTAAQGKGTITTSSNKTVLTETSKGQSQFEFPETKAWEVKDVVFSGSPLPVQHELKGQASAAGQTVETKPTEPLVVKRIPDKDPAEAVSRSITSGSFGWTSAFKIGFKDNKFATYLQMQYKKAWKGQWVTFDATADGRSDWAYVKKVGTDWKFWDTTVTPAAWKPLPRAIGSYTANTIIFIKDGSEFKDRDGGTGVWPEVFPDSPTASFDTVKATWLANIHSTWDGKFKLHRKQCSSSDPNCCTWPIKVEAKWDATSGEKLVYLIWTQFWAGNNDGWSDAQDWYIGDTDQGTAPHEFGHLLGAYDEYTGGALDLATNTVDPNTIMGQNMPLTAKTRHLDNWCHEVTAKIRAWTGHNSWEFEVKDV